MRPQGEGKAGDVSNAGSGCVSTPRQRERLYVHVARRLTPEQRARLQELLDPRITVTDGETDSVSPNTEILVSGLPTQKELSAYAMLQALIIPWASVPQSTRQVVGQFPNIAVHNLHHNAATTAELAITLLLAVAKQVIPVDRALRRNDWSSCLDPSANPLLDEWTIVLLGYGAVGQRIARACLGLGMRVIALRRHSSRPAEMQEGLEVRPSEALHDSLPEANGLIVALPLTRETHAMIGKAELELLSARAILVNVARAQIVDEEALYESLRTHRLGGAGLDVWYQEPTRDELERGVRIPMSRFPFQELDNVVMSPHRGGALGERMIELRRMDELASLLNAFIRGESMPNRVRRDLWY